MDKRTKDIVKRVCLWTGFTYNELKKRTRKQPYPFARYLVMIYLCDDLKYIQKDVASWFSLENRCDIPHGRNVITTLRELRDYPLFVNILDKFEEAKAAYEDVSVSVS
jgi:hypothetical protein